MTLAGPYYEVWCDRCNSVNGVERLGPTKRVAWRKARWAGWRKLRGEMVCPKCVAAEAPQKR